MMAWIMFLVMLVLLLFGFPMMVPLIVGAVVGFVMMFDGFDRMDFFIQQMLAGIRPTALIAVPMFILAADIMTRGQSANRLVNMVMAFIGHIKGGLAVSTAASCTLFGAVSGSTQATVVAVGSPLRPRMLESGYKDSFTLLWPLGFPVIIVGGIYGGIFSPTEAAAACVLYAVILEFVIFRSLKAMDIYAIAKSTGLITAVVFILVAVGNGFSWIISFAQIPQTLLGAIGINEAGPIGVLTAIAVAFFIACMFVDPIVVILVLTPIFAPAVASAGLDPVHVGILITMMVAVGSATPPFGCDIFTAIAIFKRPYWEVIKGTPPFVAMLLGATVLVIFFPQIALFLRDLFFL